ncbi:hypothetical protein BpHYR1_032375 [Brachionus plicatilis]|uniref:Uncharacterized protein n=1 Tax=Brachionus plicatilis TaxID=10195 RepID=A0A3M7SGT9_BRAPC|nr:hypothetical protein BpHYR1_032375 [Brachionus plicatilis]
MKLNLNSRLLIKIPLYHFSRLRQDPSIIVLLYLVLFKQEVDHHYPEMRMMPKYHEFMISISFGLLKNKNNTLLSQSLQKVISVIESSIVSYMTDDSSLY